jgi:hypothetical protein
MPEVFSTEIPELMVAHLEHLQSSAISIEIIKERGYKSILGKSQLKSLGFSRSQQRIGILMPLHGVDKEIVGYQLRPDHPREHYSDGKARKIKYENPTGSSIRLDVLPRCQANLADPKIPLFFTEGVKKVDALATAGACAVGLTGVWGFKGRNPFGGKTVLADFHSIALNERLVYLVFDSDSATNSMVRQALGTFTEVLNNKGAQVRIVHLPPGKDGSKTGADDFLAQNHNLTDIVALSVQPDYIRPRQSGFRGLYTLDAGKMSWLKSIGDGLEPIPLADFSAKIVEVITRDDGVDQSKFFHIIGREENGTPLPEVEIPVSEFDKLNWITENWDVRAVISADQTAKAKIRQALLVNSRDATRRHVYTHSGWSMVDGKPVFLTSAGAIGAPKINVDLEDDIKDYYLPNVDGAVADNDDALKASFDFLEIGNHKVLLPLWASMYLSPLTSFVDPSFTLFLVGLSGTFKSGITGLALNHFGPNFNYNRLPASWTSTENALEKLMFDLKDLPLVIDDYAPAQDAARARDLEVKVERIVRAQAFRQGRIRLTKVLSNNLTYKPRGFLLTSGEHLPSGHSHVSRMFVVEVRKDDLDQKKLFTAVDHKELLSQAMAQYIQWVAWKWDKLHQELPQQTRAWRNQAMTSSQHPRLPNAVAQLFAGLTLVLQFMVEKNIVTKLKAKALLKEGWACFMEWSAEQSARVEAERPGRRFINVFTTMHDSGRFHFGNVNDTEPRAADPGQVNAGWLDENGDYLLNPTAVYSEVRRFCANTDEPLTFKEDAVWRDLKELGLSQCVTDRNRYRARIYGTLKWVIKIQKSSLANQQEE